jgi:serine/threonine protein kinase
VGNSKYFSPEKKGDLNKEGQETTSVDAIKSDIYSLGLVFLEMMLLEYPAALFEATGSYHKTL